VVDECIETLVGPAAVRLGAMVSAGRWRTVLVGGVAACLVGLSGCGAASGPEQPTPGSTTTATSPDPSPSTAGPTPTTGDSPTTSSPTASSPTASSPTSTTTGLTLRELGFENGPLDEFTLPADAVISTSVDQPNVVTIVLARPSPQTVEDYLRATLPDAGFTIDARAAAGAAMTFKGNGWTGGFTGTAATSAIVLRPSS
jgi:hypothetical protein